ncbi:MAG TPA: hypothetical protein VGR56_02705 [Nitrososphaerales archaeon]|nr:hypothetical protein [Nitrososphaerales archaeon]
MKGEVKQRILSLIGSKQAATFGEITHEGGVPESSAAKFLGQFTTDGLVEKEGGRYRLTEAGQEFVSLALQLKSADEVSSFKGISEEMARRVYIPEIMTYATFRVGMMPAGFHDVPLLELGNMRNDEVRAFRERHFAEYDASREIQSLLVKLAPNLGFKKDKKRFPDNKAASNYLGWVMTLYDSEIQKELAELIKSTGTMDEHSVSGKSRAYKSMIERAETESRYVAGLRTLGVESFDREKVSDLVTDKLCVSIKNFVDLRVRGLEALSARLDLIRGTLREEKIK